MPRVLNGAIAVFLLCCIFPLVTTFPRHSPAVRVYLVVAVLPVLLVVVLCLASALRPGSLGRAARRLRARRQRSPGQRSPGQSSPGPGAPGRAPVMTYARGRDESPEQRADRNWNDLLQELRVTETGVQVLFSVLLTVPFSARFGQATDLQRRVYFTALLLTAGSSITLIAPVAYHRLLFGRGEKPRLVHQSGRVALAGLVLLALAVSAVLLLVTDVLFGTPAAAAVAGPFGLATLALWFGPPARQRRRDRPPG